MHEKGISAERLVFTTLHAGGKFDNSAYKTSGGLHGVGSSVVNALSTKLTVRVKSGGFIYEDRYERGIPVMDLVDGLLPVVGKTRETGTTINFLPDDTIFDKTRFKEDDVKSRLHETAYLNPKLTIIFEDKRKEEPEKVTYHEPEGIIGFIKDMNHSKETVHDVIFFSGESEGISVEVAFQFVNEFHENVLGFFLCLTDLGCLFRTADNALQSLQIAVEEPDDLFAGHLGHGLGGILVVQFRLGLAFETGIRVLDGYHCRHSVPDIGTGKVCILFL